MAVNPVIGWQHFYVSSNAEPVLFGVNHQKMNMAPIACKEIVQGNNGGQELKVSMAERKEETITTRLM
jgi:hypothetical protein